jgi:hypothetical protein
MLGSVAGPRQGMMPDAAAWAVAGNGQYYREKLGQHTDHGPAVKHQRRTVVVQVEQGDTALEWVVVHGSTDWGEGAVG